MKWKSRRSMASLVIGPCLLGLVSCAGDTGGGGGDAQQQQAPQQQDDHGVFRATLAPLNGSNTVGEVLITVLGDEFKVQMVVNGAPASISHMQHIHAGSACPTTTADVNRDGFVDVIEGVPSYGKILIPLDGNLNSQAAGILGSPMANSRGRYVYSRSASYTRLLADLHAPDPDPTDAIVKLNTGENLNLVGRHVIVHGVSGRVNLPNSVATLPGLTNNMTLPIACGQIVRILNGDEATTSGTIIGAASGAATGTTTGTSGTPAATATSTVTVTSAAAGTGTGTGSGSGSGSTGTNGATGATMGSTTGATTGATTGSPTTGTSSGTTSSAGSTTGTTSTMSSASSGTTGTTGHIHRRHP